MIELKADNTFVFGEECLAYKKSEADAVIADLKKNLSEIQSQKMQLEDDVALLRRNNAELKAENERLRGESCKLTDGCLRLKQCRKEKANIADKLRHQKYKRCLTMAKWCYSMDCKMLDEAADNGTFFKESWCWKRAMWYGKWKRKWLELAEKFKEVI